MFILNLLGNYYLLLILAAILPPAAALFIVRRLDRMEPEPAPLLIKLYFRGILAMIPIYILEVIAETFVENRAWNELQYMFLCYFCIPGIIEEGVKYFTLKKNTWNAPDFNHTFDAIVYAVFVSMGFASIENIMYVATAGGLLTAVSRAVFAIPGHAMFGIYMGIFYSKAKRHEAAGNAGGAEKAKICAAVVPMIFHGLYDFLLMTYGGAVFYIYFAIAAAVAAVSLKKASKNDTPIFPDRGFPML